jgi:hypothetical protein
MFQNILLTISQQALSTDNSNIHSHHHQNIRTLTSWSIGQKIFFCNSHSHIKWLSGPISSYTCWYVSHCGLGSRLSVKQNIRCFRNINKIKLQLLFKSYIWCWYWDQYFLHIISISILTVKIGCWNWKNTHNQRQIQSTTIVVVFYIIHFT